MFTSNDILPITMSRPHTPLHREQGPVAVTFRVSPNGPLLSDGSDISARASSADLLPDNVSSSASSIASHSTPDTQSSSAHIAANPLASTLTSLATTIESMRGQDTPAAHTTMASLSSTMTALATAITSLHTNTPTTPTSSLSSQTNLSSGPVIEKSQQNNSSPPNNDSYQTLSQSNSPYQTIGTINNPYRDSFQSTFSNSTPAGSQNSLDHPFRATSPRELEGENAHSAAIDELRAEQAKLRTLIESTAQSAAGGSTAAPRLPARPIPNFPVPAPPRPIEWRTDSPGAAQPRNGAADAHSPPTSVPLATQHQLFAQSMATLLDALDGMGNDIQSARRTAIEREASFGREVTRFFHELDAAQLTAQRLEFLCTFGKRCLLAQLAKTTAGTASIESLVGQHEVAREQASHLAEIASSLAKTRTQLEAAASASADREATLALEKTRVVGEKERIAGEKDRLVAQLQAVHAAAAEHDKAVANERGEKDARIAELKKDLASLTDTLNASVEVLDAIRQKGARAESWRAAENIRSQLRWAKDKVQRNKNDNEQSLSHTMAARLALVAPQQGADSLKARRPRAPGRLPLSTVDE
ncbi:hypothetical protein CC85DRAFT_315634 [Cutaneotrichosporon oleaginosum]|uniref:Uncharacterized protein n=1 Tax=Cutaneotrichosporon oleaginosum TaxID=879819 RepID=A0A0J0XT73_9TREE|nr:uncharacterized protein CC85DRAFT_315634 [Cutaneotrichosporon oleaginosum]KLT44286.1 hypothetical protein CC85DRAFT_315634 [Cutaneotrichosporon oleaginosum]TXT11547.1 hypothetical protein COLE_01957 [Cutaneotrichosporon oleaginosum]